MAYGTSGAIIPLNRLPGAEIPAVRQNRRLRSWASTATKPTIDTATADSDDHSTLDVRSTPKGAVWLASGAEALVASGFLTDQKVDSGTASLELKGNPFGVVTAVALDGQPLSASKHLLVTAVSRAANQGMTWNAAHTSVSDQWGHGPVLAEGLSGICRFPFGSGSATAYALDANGQRRATVPLTRSPAGQVELPMDTKHQTLWYEIIAK